MFNLKTAERVEFNGNDTIVAIVTGIQPYPNGTEYNSAPFMKVMAEEARTRTPFSWNIKPYGIAPRYFKDEDGVVHQYECEQFTCCRALSKALGYSAPCFDINKVLTAFSGAAFCCTVKEENVLDEDGEIRRTENGLPMKWYRVKLLTPDSGELPHEESMAEKINSQNAAKAESKRAQKGKRGYAGNTGDC